MHGIDHFITVYINDPFWGIIHTCEGSFKYDVITVIKKKTLEKTKKRNSICSEVTPEEHVRGTSDNPGENSLIKEQHDSSPQTSGQAQVPFIIIKKY